MPSTTYSLKIEFADKDGASNSDGFIDVKTIEQYRAEGDDPETYEASLTKERGNIRFDLLREQLQLEANLYIQDAATTGASANDAGTEFNCTIIVEHGDGVLVTRDELNSGAILTGTSAIKRWAARALISSLNCFSDAYDPSETAGSGYNEGELAARAGVRIERITVGALATDLSDAEDLITVTAVTEE